MFEYNLFKKFSNLSKDEKNKIVHGYIICIIIVLVYLYIIKYLNMEHYGYEITDYDVIGRSIIFGEQKYDVINNIVNILIMAGALGYLTS